MTALLLPLIVDTFKLSCEKGSFDKVPVPPVVMFDAPITESTAPART
jgi:hypothetical protein